MESTVANALVLLAVGMITVFIILSLVVILGTVLIKITNKLYKEPAKQSSLMIPTKTVAVVTAVVEHITNGHGKVESIEIK